ncbi:MAG: hypothetical protein HY063_05180 [Bacteroidetes bacterium]|nr:hypothetical protein [Bacteroidota bacterium]
MKKKFTFYLFFLFPFYSLAQPTLWGMTAAGGNQFGTIFSINPGDTTLKSVYKIKGNAGATITNYAIRLIEANNGKFYGVTNNGGASGNGTLFELGLSQQR